MCQLPLSSILTRDFLEYTAKDFVMLQPILLILLLVIIIGVFVYMTYRDNARRTKSKKRNQYNDRV